MRHEPPGVEKSGSAERMHPYRRSPPSTSLEASRPQRGSRDNSIGVANSPSTASPSSTSVTSPLRNLAPNGVSSQAGHQSTARTSQVSPAATTSTTSRNMVQDATSNAPAPPSATSSGINTTSPHHYFQSRGSDGRNDPPRYDFVGQEGVATRQLPPPVSSGLSRGDMAMHYNTRRNLPSAPNSGDYNNAFNSAGATYLPDLSAAQSHRTPHDYASALPSLRNVTTLQSRELQTQDPIPRRPIMSPHSGRMVDGDMTPPPRPAEAQNAATVEGHRNISDHRTQLPEPPGTAEALFDPAEPSLYPKQRLSEMRSGPRRSTRDRPN